MNYLPERIQQYISPEPNSGCWLWTGSAQPNGYGVVGFESKMQRAHRVVYRLIKGAIPQGLDLDHLCRIRCCVNPDHLEPVTRRENLRRGNGWSGRKMRQTHCKNGHLLEGANLILRGPKKQRRCRICENAYQRKCNHRYDRKRNPL